MCPGSTNLVYGDPLPNGDEVSRFCRPCQYDHVLDEPMAIAFMRRENEPDLSVNHLQFFVGQGRTDAVNCIRRELEGYFTLGKTGGIVVFNVAKAKAAAQKRGFDIRIIYTPEFPLKPSHSSVLDLPADHKDELKVAAAIMRLITQADTYPAVV